MNKKNESLPSSILFYFINTRELGIYYTLGIIPEHAIFISFASSTFFLISSILLVQSISKYLSFIKFSHTVFALPFAIIGFVWGLATVEQVDYMLFVYVLLCMAFARSAAMGFNRIVDRVYDKENVRTAVREIPSGVISLPAAKTFVFINSLLFVLCTYLINPLCFYLSPVALAVILGYSYTKRYSYLCHMVLGLGLGLAPVGAFLAVTGAFQWPILVMGSVVLCWVSGFDIVYALQDIDFDRAHGLKSIPSQFGVRRAITISIGLHILSSVGLVALGYFLDLGVYYWLGGGLFILFLIYQHLLVKPDNLNKINLAFFTSNGIASLVFGVLVVLDFIIG